MKKILIALLLLFLVVGITSCTQEDLNNVINNNNNDDNELVDPVEFAKTLFDTPAAAATDTTKYVYDHFFSNQIRLSDMGVDVPRDKDGKLAGKFLEDKIAKLPLKYVTDGDTAVFHLTQGEIDNVTAIVNGEARNHDYISVRYQGIDTPESTSSIDPWGKAASNYAKQLLKTSEGIIVDATQLSNDDNYKFRLDSNKTRWLGLVWYCPQGGDPEDLSQYRSYQLDLIEECYSFSTGLNDTRIAYNAKKASEPILYGRYKSSYGSMTLSEVFYDASMRMQKTGKNLRVQGEEDPHFDYSKNPTSLTITEAMARIDELMNAGTLVELTGVITRFAGNNFYMEDREGTPLYVYMGIDGNSIGSMFKQGETIRIRGRLCKYGGQYQMSGVVFKRETFTKVTGEDAIPMPDPIQLTGTETLEQIKGMLGKLVTTDFTVASLGKPSKDGSYSVYSNTTIPGHAETKYSTDSVVQLRVNGTLIPGYESSFFTKNAEYSVTGIMAIYFEEDYQDADLMANPENYYAYQIVCGNDMYDADGNAIRDCIKK